MSELQQQQSDIKTLIAKGKEKGFLTYAEVNDHLPDGIVDSEQIEDIISVINDIGITVYENTPDAEALELAKDNVTDEDAAEEAAAALTTLDSEFGRTTDPVRMYMREMGTVELLTREGEIAIAKRIEEGLAQVQHTLSEYPSCVETVLSLYEQHEAEEVKLADIITGFIDPNAVDEEIPTPAQKSGDDSDMGGQVTSHRAVAPTGPTLGAVNDHSAPGPIDPGEHPVDLGLTHVALPVERWEETLEFYAEFASMEVVHERGEPGERVAWISDRTRPLVVVLLERSVDHPLGGWSHLGVGVESRRAVDETLRRATEAGFE